jgi:hypothetical protein
MRIFRRADQASFHRDAVFDHHVLHALHAAANPRAGVNVQLASNYKIAVDHLAGVNFEVAVVKEALGRSRACARRGGGSCGAASGLLAAGPVSIRGAFIRRKLQSLWRRMSRSEEVRP